MGAGIVSDDVVDDVSPEFLDESKTIFYKMVVVMERIAQQKYTTHQQQSGHSGLVVEKYGLFGNPWLATTPDGMVQPLWFLPTIGTSWDQDST